MKKLNLKNKLKNGVGICMLIGGLLGAPITGAYMGGYLGFNIFPEAPTEYKVIYGVLGSLLGACITTIAILPVSRKIIKKAQLMLN